MVYRPKKQKGDSTRTAGNHVLMPLLCSCNAHVCTRHACDWGVRIFCLKMLARCSKSLWTPSGLGRTMDAGLFSPDPKPEQGQAVKHAAASPWGGRNSPRFSQARCESWGLSSVADWSKFALQGSSVTAAKFICLFRSACLLAHLFRK